MSDDIYSSDDIMDKFSSSEDEEEHEEEEEEEVFLFRTYKGSDYTSSGEGKHGIVYRFNRWKLDLVKEGYNLDESILKNRTLDLDNIIKIIYFHEGTEVKLVKKKISPKNKREEISDFSRDVFTHMMFDTSSLLPPLISAEDGGERTMLCMGGNFGSVYENGSMFNTLQIKHIFYQLVAFIDLFHRCEWVHQDIKPMNILYQFPNSIPRVTVCDFGYSKSYRYSSKADFIGAAGWAAPETFIGLIAPQSMTFSIGCFILSLLNGSSILDNFVSGMDKDKGDINKECLLIYYTIFGRPKSKWFKSFKPRYTPVSYKIHIKLPFDATKEDSHAINDLINSMIRINPDDRASPETLLNHPWFKDMVPIYKFLLKENKIIEKRVNSLYSYVDLFKPPTEWMEWSRENFVKDISDMSIPINKILNTLGYLDWMDNPSKETSYTSLISLFDVHSCIPPKYPTQTHRSIMRLTNTINWFIKSLTGEI